jgi:hypothetical protein
MAQRSKLLMQTWHAESGISGTGGRNVFPEHSLVPPANVEAGSWVCFTDGSIRRVAKVEQTIGYGAQGDRYMVTTTILFDDDEGMWRGEPLAKP